MSTRRRRWSSTGSRGGTGHAAGRRCPGPQTRAPGSPIGRPWLPFGADAGTRNVAAQEADPASVLSTYRQLIALRAASPALQLGALTLHADATGDLIAYTRETADQVVLVLINTGRDGASWRLTAEDAATAWRPLFGTARTASSDDRIATGTTLILGPDEALILERLA